MFSGYRLGYLTHVPTLRDLRTSPLRKLWLVNFSAIGLSLVSQNIWWVSAGQGLAPRGISALSLAMPAFGLHHKLLKSGTRTLLLLLLAAISIALGGRLI